MQKVLRLKLWVRMMITIILLLVSLFLYAVNGFENVELQEVTWLFLFPFIGYLLLLLWEE